MGGVALDILVVMWDTTMQREIPQESLSRVSSYDALGTLMLGPLGLLLAGPSVGLIGAGNALLISAGVTALASAAALCSPGVRNLTWSSAQPKSDLVSGRPAELARTMVELDRSQRPNPVMLDV